MITNLVVIFPNALELILTKTAILYKIFAHLGNTDKKLVKNCIELLTVFIRHANLDQLENMVEEGMSKSHNYLGLISYLNDKISIKNSSPELLEEYVVFVFSLLDTERSIDSESDSIIDEFR